MTSAKALRCVTIACCTSAKGEQAHVTANNNFSITAGHEVTRKGTQRCPDFLLGIWKEGGSYKTQKLALELSCHHAWPLALTIPLLRRRWRGATTTATSPSTFCGPQPTIATSETHAGIASKHRIYLRHSSTGVRSTWPAQVTHIQTSRYGQETTAQTGRGLQRHRTSWFSTRLTRNALSLRPRLALLGSAFPPRILGPPSPEPTVRAGPALTLLDTLDPRTGLNHRVKLPAFRLHPRTLGARRPR